MALAKEVSIMSKRYNPVYDGSMMEGENIEKVQKNTPTGP